MFNTCAKRAVRVVFILVFFGRFCLYTGCYELFCIETRIALLLWSREMKGNIFFYPNKSIVPDYLVHDFFFNFGDSVIYFLPIGDYTLVELCKCSFMGKYLML